MKIIQKLDQYDARNRFFKSLSHAHRILELGCNTGSNCETIHTLYPQAEIHGVDIMPENEIAPFIHYKYVNLEKQELPYEDGYFDAILIIHVLEHVSNAYLLCKEIHRIMKPGARIYVEVPNWTTMFVPSIGISREQHDVFNFFDDPSHQKPWSKQGLFEFVSFKGKYTIEKLGNRRNWCKIPIDLLKIFKGCITQNRLLVTQPFWNVFGWCIYAIGVKM